MTRVRTLRGLVIVLALGAGLIALPWPQALVQGEAEVTDLEAKKLSELSGRLTLDELERAFALVDPHRQLEPYLERDERALRYFADPERRRLIVEVALTRQVRPRPAASARRVVLDPGHRGGAWSHTERRHVVLGTGAPVREGDLTWATAKLLSSRLERAGMSVELTRQAPPTLPFPQGIHAGYDARREAERWLSERSATGAAPLWRRWPSMLGRLAFLRDRATALGQEPFEIYNRFELSQRAARAGADDLFVSLHYNMMGQRGENGVLVFVPGNFMLGELSTPSQRHLAVRRALDGTLPETIELARRVAVAMHRELGLGPLPIDTPSSPGEASKLPVDEKLGVYARNLAVLRYARGVSLLVEGPCMDHPEEHWRLAHERVERDGAAVLRRADEYARAVAEGLGAP